MAGFTTLEVCAGAGGQALGLEQAGFKHIAAVEIDHDACATLQLNRPQWNVIMADVRQFNGRQFQGVDLLAAGIPCPPFSIAGKQLGRIDDRDLFPEVLRLTSEVRPKVVLVENVPGFASRRFQSYRRELLLAFARLGYETDWKVINASAFSVPQLRPRFVLVAMRPAVAARFSWPRDTGNPPTVGEALADLMASGGWPGAAEWTRAASGIAPTIVGGSKKHGGPDLGPTRARRAWQSLRVDGLGIADSPPGPDFPPCGMPRLTIRMVARLQGFPDDWQFSGGKTAAYRQVGNAFPPPVARAVGHAIASALRGETVMQFGQMRLESAVTF